MVKVRLKWVKKVRKRGRRKGNRTLYYWRRPGHPLRRLPDDPDDPQFIRQVMAWNAEADTAAKETGPPEGSFAHLVALYKRSPDFERLAPATREGYEYWLAKLEERYGDLPVRGITRQVVYRLRDSMAATPYKANAVIRVLRLLLNFSVDRGQIKTNPAARPKQLRVRPRRQVWSPEAETAFLEKADATMKLAYMLAAYTAQRQADILAMTWAQYDGQVIRLRQRKTGALVEVPCHRDLKVALDAAERRGTVILTTLSGRPWKAYHFRHTWKMAMKKARIDGLQFRDLRRTAMVRMAEAGATAIETAAVSGHTIDQTQRILEAYIPRTAAMGRAAIVKLEGRRKGRRERGTK
jgi:integrase